VKNIDTAEAETFFANLLQDCAMGELPEDWRERVRIGSDRQQSGTARENLAGGGNFEVPDELPEIQKRLVNYAAPGLREVLGYE
jgi:isopenicillin N synthase-like dioxygenase